MSSQKLTPEIRVHSLRAHYSSSTSVLSGSVHTAIQSELLPLCFFDTLEAHTEAHLLDRCLQSGQGQPTESSLYSQPGVWRSVQGEARGPEGFCQTGAPALGVPH